jgi:hypothetical protein
MSETVLIDLRTSHASLFESVRLLNSNESAWWMTSLLFPAAVAAGSNGKKDKNQPKQPVQFPRMLGAKGQIPFDALIEQQILDREAQEPRYQAHRAESEAMLTQLLAERFIGDGLVMLEEAMVLIQSQIRQTEHSVVTRLLRRPGRPTVAVYQEVDLANPLGPLISKLKLRDLSDEDVRLENLPGKTQNALIGVAARHRYAMSQGLEKLLEAKLLMEVPHRLVGFQDSVSANTEFMTSLFSFARDEREWCSALIDSIRQMLDLTDEDIVRRVLFKLEWRRCMLVTLANACQLKVDTETQTSAHAWPIEVISEVGEDLVYRGTIYQSWIDFRAATLLSR